MANVTITAANVRYVDGNTEALLSAAAGAAGEVVFKNGSDKLALADNDDTSKDEVYGILIATGVTDQYVTVQRTGNVTLENLTAGTEYYLSSTAGKICPHADLNTSDRVIRIGYATTTTNLVLDVQDLGVIL